MMCFAARERLVLRSKTTSASCRPALPGIARSSPLLPSHFTCSCSIFWVCGDECVSVVIVGSSLMHRECSGVHGCDTAAAARGRVASSASRAPPLLPLLPLPPPLQLHQHPLHQRLASASAPVLSTRTHRPFADAAAIAAAAAASAEPTFSQLFERGDSSPLSTLLPIFLW